MRSLVLIAAALGASAVALSASAQTGQSMPNNPASAAQPSMTSQTQTQTSTSSSASSSTSSDTQVCKSVTTRGTRIPKRECHTQAEWDQMRADAQENLAKPNQNPGGPH